MRIIKYLITDCKKIILYGDCMLHKWGYSYDYRGKMIKVKILGIFWFNYGYFLYKNIKPELRIEICPPK